MIVVCEPQCKAFSHEKVNSGFLYGLHLAYPQEKIRLYADISHIEAIKQVLINDNVSIDDIEYVAIAFGNPHSLVGMLGYYFLFKRIFTDALSVGINKVFFLSFSSRILCVIKTIKRQKKFSTMKLTSVLHGEFESIAEDTVPSSLPLPPIAPLGARIRKSSLIELPRKAIRRLKLLANAYVKGKSEALSSHLFPVKKILLWRHSADFKFIALAPHVVANAKKYIDVVYLNVHTIVLPTVFAAPLPLPENTYPKFAIFGYGNSSMLYQVLFLLSQKKIEKPYEIRIIGVDGRGSEGFQNVNMPVRDRGLSRTEMEKYAEDIDAFLILYEKDKYRLSCSGSILESLSYMKPILHFDNVCMNAFNKGDLPIGIRSDTVDGYVDVMIDIIENYPEFRRKSEKFRDNIMRLRDEFSIKNSAMAIRKSFTWSS